jgi:hypothetical protein
MASFGYYKTSKTLKIFHDNILEFKINFDPIVNEEDWIKLMYIEYITYNFSMTIGLHVCAS